jgi:O-glycosyl hydrolase
MAGNPARIALGISSLALTFVACQALPWTATIKWQDQHQVIDGFGGSCAELSPAVLRNPMDIAGEFVACSSRSCLRQRNPFHLLRCGNGV